MCTTDLQVLLLKLAYRLLEAFERGLSNPITVDTVDTFTSRTGVNFL
jgi:hypothetical protein